MNKRSMVTLAAAVAFAGCSTQSRVAGAVALPQSNAIAQHLSRGHSWMLSDAASQELVYVSSQGVWGRQGVYVYSYPQGKRVGFLQPDSEETYEGLCSDTHGNVWVVGWITNKQSFFDEYAHGGT